MCGSGGLQPARDAFCNQMAMVQRCCAGSARASGRLRACSRKCDTADWEGRLTHTHTHTVDDVTSRAPSRILLRSLVDTNYLWQQERVGNKDLKSLKYSIYAACTHALESQMQAGSINRRPVPVPQETPFPAVPSAARASTERISMRRLGLERIRIASEWVTVPVQAVAFEGRNLQLAKIV